MTLGVCLLLLGACAEPARCLETGACASEDAGLAVAGDRVDAPAGEARDGGGSPGPDAGEQAFPMPRCASVVMADAAVSSAGPFAPRGGAERFLVELMAPGQTGIDVMSIELRPAPGEAALVPPEVMLWATTLSECDVCVSLRRGCNPEGRACAERYLAFGGLVRFTEALSAKDAGALSGTVGPVRLLAWDAALDRARLDAGCVEVAPFVFSARWGPADAGR